MTSTGSVNRRDIQNDLPINDPINDPISGINSRDGQRIVAAARRSGAVDTTSVRYDSTQVTNELRRAFNGGYRDVVRLLKTWGWKQAAIDQLFPAGESGNFNWNVFFDRIQGVVMAYDQMPADQKTVYCQVRGIADPNRGWANFNEFAPRTSMNQADSTIREVSTIIAETNTSIENGGGRPTDSAAALIYDTVLMLRETNSQYVRLGDAGQIRGWAPWLKEAVYLRLATNAGSQYLVARSNGTREVKHQELRTYLLGARRREENRSSESHDVASNNGHTRRRTDQTDGHRADRTTGNNNPGTNGWTNATSCTVDGNIPTGDLNGQTIYDQVKGRKMPNSTIITLDMTLKQKTESPVVYYVYYRGGAVRLELKKENGRMRVSSAQRFDPPAGPAKNFCDGRRRT
jgi:hypothetical protein